MGCGELPEMSWLTIELVCIVSFGLALQLAYVLAFWIMTKFLDRLK